MKNKLKNQLGISTLVLVFIVASLLTLIISALILITFLAATRSAQVLHTQKAFFAAEGALYATIQRLKEDPNWRPPYEYQIGDIIIKSEVSSINGGVNILVAATLKGTKRTLAGTYGVGETGRTPLDIILVLDRSGSMEGNPYNQAKNAAKAFINFAALIEEDAIGVVSYSNIADNNLRLTLREDETAINLIENTIDNLEDATGRTNIGHAIQLAKEELDNPPPEVIIDREDSIKVIIVLSDGISNRKGTEETCEQPSPCMNPYMGNPYRPLNDDSQNSGTLCTEDAIMKAEEAQDSEYHVFSIFLENVDNSSCYCNNAIQCPDQYRDGCTEYQPCLLSTEDLGRRTLQAIADKPSYYFETDTPEDLTPIYNQIAEEITSPGFFKIWEEVPEPD
jgi:hypothetical protein